jgi:CRP-like cAMP-binding protein
MPFSELIKLKGQQLHFVGGDHVFHQGDKNGFVYVLIEGLLKAYYLSHDGEETIKSFIQPGELIGSLTSVYMKETCSFSLVCLQDSSLVQLDFDEIQRLVQKDLRLANEFIEQLLKFGMKKEQREKDFLTLSAEQRYQLLMETSSSLLESVRQKDIARYLGITPVALSRIRRRLNSKG